MDSIIVPLGKYPQNLVEDEYLGRYITLTDVILYEISEPIINVFTTFQNVTSLESWLQQGNEEILNELVEMKFATILTGDPHIDLPKLKGLTIYTDAIHSGVEENGFWYNITLDDQTTRICVFTSWCIACSDEEDIPTALNKATDGNNEQNEMILSAFYSDLIPLINQGWAFIGPTKSEIQEYLEE
jgi:hypothetical protein